MKQEGNVGLTDQGLGNSYEVYYDLNDISPTRRAIDQAIVNFVDKCVGFAMRHALALLNIASGLILIGAFAVPVLFSRGYGWIAGPVFHLYRIICVQNPDHSYFISGYQMAMDQRMTAIFGSLFIAGVFLTTLGKNVRPLGWRGYVLLILPLAIDGFTQLFGWRQSNWQLRTVTGILFGVAHVWLAYPQFALYMALMRSRARRQ